MKVGLHIFRRDLRLEDNTALIEALRNCDLVIPCFIFDPRQVERNNYRSDKLVQFMVNCLNELNDRLKNKGSKLYLFYGKSEEVISNLLEEGLVNEVYFNKDYTPFSLKRDEKIFSVCKGHDVDCFSFDDSCINAPGSILKDDGKPYTVFSPFYRKSLNFPVKKPVSNNLGNYYSKNVIGDVGVSIFDKVLGDNNGGILINGGFKEAISLLAKTKCLGNYSEDRNFPSILGTSHLSAHNKFGTISIRKVFHVLASAHGVESTIVSELYWRDFFTHVSYHFPNVYGGAFKKKFDGVPWSDDKVLFKKWCDGMTGFPLVDAGMRELVKTGYMHNRVRMVVASFLVKDLHIDWRWGEKFFAQHLIDYDPAVNNGNWQWAASTGCDAQPYFRVFNPWRQQERFDSDCLYIKKWVPELSSIEPKQIHNLFKKFPEGLNYPRPIVDHSVESKIAIEMFKGI